jgi:SAM-dependent methyltransferase
MAELGRAEGIAFRFDRIRRIPHSLDAHRLVRWAGRFGAADAVVDALFEAYFTAGPTSATRRCSPPSRRAGSRPAAARRFLSSAAEVEAVHADNLRAHRLGINGVPCFVVAGRHAIAGAQEPGGAGAPPGRGAWWRGERRHRRSPVRLTPDSDAYLDRLPQDGYAQTHRLRFRETWTRLHDLASDAKDVLELGILSPVGTFLRDHRGARVGAVETDLRFPPYPAPDAGADLVLCLEVLEHLNDAHRPGASIGEVAMFTHSGARAMFRECRRVLHPGGRLALTTPNAASVDVLGNVLRRRHPCLYPPHVRAYAPAEVVGLAGEAGFEAERTSTFFAWNPHPDVDRDALVAGMDALGFDMADRGDDAFFVFRAPP